MKNNELIREEFSKRLKEALAINNKSGWGEGAYLAKITKVTPKASNKWLNAESIPNREKIIQLAKILNVNSLWLEYGEGSIQPNKKEDHVEIIGEISPWDNNTPLDSDEVEIPIIEEVELSAGLGNIITTEFKTNKKLRFNTVSLIKQGVNYSQSVCVTVSGNSMEPFIPNGATVGIDTSNTNIIDGKIYAVLIENDFARLKQLYRLPNNRVRLRSFNREEYEDEEYSLEDIRVVGKVFWSSVLWD